MKGMKGSRGPKVVAIYCRVSTEEQRREGASVERQEGILRRWVADRFPGASIEVFCDIGSGRNESRARYKMMMRGARSGAIGAIAAVELSRLWRNVRIALRAMGELEEAGCDVMLFSQGIDTSTAYGRAMFVIFSALAALESDITSERNKRSADQAKREGRKGAGRRPYGWGVRDDGRLYRHEREQGSIDLVTGWRINGSSWAECARKLDESGRLTASGHEWTGDGLRLVYKAVMERRAIEAEGKRESGRSREDEGSNEAGEELLHTGCTRFEQGEMKPRGGYPNVR